MEEEGQKATALDQAQLSAKLTFVATTQELNQAGFETSCGSVF